MFRHIKKVVLLLMPMCLIINATVAEIPSASAGEMYECDRWVSSCFFPLQPNPEKAEIGGTLSIISGGTNWWDRVQHNNVWGKPFRLNGRRYNRGLFTHAPHQIKVRLLEPAVTFEAVVGIINVGTAVFTVDVEDSEAYRSAVLKGQGGSLLQYVLILREPLNSF